jgi:hypothetical protein
MGHSLPLELLQKHWSILLLAVVDMAVMVMIMNILIMAVEVLQDH